MQAQIYRHTVVFTASCYVALRLTEQTLRPSIERVWAKLTSDEALDLYAYVIVFLHDIAILSARLAISAGRDCRRWADAYVDTCLVQTSPAVESLLPDPWESPLEAVERMEAPAAIYPAVPYLLLLAPGKDDAQPLPTTIRELRQLCQKKGAARWNKDRCVQALTA